MLPSPSPHGYQSRSKKIIAALVDLHWSSDDARKKFDCAACTAKSMKVAKARRCLEPGYNQLADKPIAVDQYGLRLPFCPGKARWSEEMGELFNACLVLTETGLGPTAGGLSDQSDMLNEVLPTFLTRWRDRTYQRVWADVRDWTKTVLESVFGKKK